MTDQSSKAPPNAALLKARDDLWAQHPFVSASCKLPTRSVLWTRELVKRTASRQRSSIAMWAHPTTGKSFCIECLSSLLTQDFPGSGFFVYEAKRKDYTDEEQFLEDLLAEMDYELPVARTLAARRTQFKRALYAASAPRSHLFMVLDEAQHLRENVLDWLKNIVNWLTKQGVRVTVVLFGQQELLTRRDELVATGRSDLVIRYMQQVVEFEGIRSAADLASALRACDVASEFPPGTGWSYTQFVWPHAFTACLRLERHADALWLAFIKSSPTTKGTGGIAMQWIALTLSELATATKERDSTSFEPTHEDWMAAIQMSGYVERMPTLRKMK